MSRREDINPPPQRRRIADNVLRPQDPMLNTDRENERIAFLQSVQENAVNRPLDLEWDYHNIAGDEGVDFRYDSRYQSNPERALIAYLHFQEIYAANRRDTNRDYRFPTPIMTATGKHPRLIKRL